MEGPGECHNKKAQSIPSTKRKRNLPKTETTKLHVNNLAKLPISCFREHIKQMSRVTRKPTFCISKNKDADQLRGNRDADQRLCFRYLDSTIPLLPKSEISSL